MRLSREQFAARTTVIAAVGRQLRDSWRPEAVQRPITLPDSPVGLRNRASAMQVDENEFPSRYLGQCRALKGMRIGR